MQEVNIRVPATTANMGAGFDTFGMAFAMYNTVALKRITGNAIRLENLGAHTKTMEQVKDNLTVRSARKVFDAVGEPFAGLEFKMYNVIPVSRGLGSSSAAIIGGLMAANRLLGDPLDKAQLLELAVELEGHSDNVAPALYGGFVSSCQRGGKTVALKLTPPANLAAVVAIPDFYLSTSKARKILAPEVKRADAVHNIQCAALMVGAMATGDLQLFAAAFDDRLHQEQRYRLIKGAKRVLRAARSAGAIAAGLSGAGPTMIAFINTEDNRAEQIKKAMQRAWEFAGVSAKTMLLEQDNQGAQDC
ncbi:MAG TPA: homoserine kinase [Candidatus Avidehalobacter gallistercoris]|uniref:Homoserine kinase n=1 Tax=Candidatus Avidehalobacter gallistercoris TaxID=2840694 RepID=A0A9D1HJE2_9FIRM|nr:homoserine kinase [Candidatus Avidehalobacter gallistercoris]